MASINRLKPGQVVYDIQRQKMGNTTVSRGVLYEVKILEVHEDFVLASWNSNKPQKYFLRSIQAWRVKKPEPKGTIFGLPNYR